MKNNTEKIGTLCNAFFDMIILEKNEQDSRKTGYIQQALERFMSCCTKENAYDVYSIFFDVYRIKKTDGTSFVDLLDMMRSYEEKASVLNERQRDHYVHSVNVFALGLSIYANNEEYRNMFNAFMCNKNASKRLFSGDCEEFLFRWGVASLLHDIGYPMEIICNQIYSYVSFVAGSKEKAREIHPYIDFMNFEELNSISNSGWLGTDVIGDGQIQSYKPTELLAYRMTQRFGIDIEQTKALLNGYLKTMQEKGFVDHGFYSALILLKWYGEFAENAIDGQEYFLYPILDIAHSILEHNFYKGTLQKNCGLDRLKCDADPLSYILILCDELQEWNREGYGMVDRTSVRIDDTALDIGNDKMHIHYITRKGIVQSDFISNKEKTIGKILDLKSIFREGIDFTATTLTEQFIDTIKTELLVPRPLIENIEKIAMDIHERYNQTQLERYPDKPLEYPTWESLPDTMRYSNVRQAKTISEKLALVGCYYAEAAVREKDIEVTDFDAEELETMAIYEHELWAKERIQNGWTYGPVKDTIKLTTPYLVPYEELSEEIKQLDRDTIKNIFELVGKYGMKVYKASQS